MPKKKVNGFFLFMRDYMNKEQNKGRKINMGQAQNEAGKIWTGMTDQQKGIYNQKAKDENIKGKEEVKLTSQGVPVTEIEKEKRDKDNEERLMKKYIEDNVKINFINNTLENQKYYFIMANYFTKNTEENIYIPAEIALSEYSIKDGVTNKFHSFVNPVVEMFGHAYEAKVHSEATHKLPLPPNALGEKNLERLYYQILKFIQTDGNIKDFPPLYTHKESIPIVKSVLNYLQNDANQTDVDLKIYPMHYLFFTLKKATAEIGENIKPPSIHVTDAILDRDHYEYETDISCDYHEKSDNGKYCALSCVVRWTFTFSENLCNDLAIQMVPGRHAPQNTVQVKMTDLNSSMLSISQSEESFAMSKAESNITIPKMEREDWNATASCYSLTSEEFPTLGSKKNKHSKSQLSGTIRNDSDDDDDNDDDIVDNGDDRKRAKKKNENPWSLRSKIRPKLPSENSFNFSSVLTGHGRGITKVENNTVNPPVTSLRGHGRGRFFLNQN